MKVIQTGQNLSGLTPQETEWVYNGLDAMLTKEIDEETETLLSPETRMVYDFALRQLRPALVMMLRGIRVDQARRANMLAVKIQAKRNVETWLDELGDAIGFGSINARSPQQLKDLFYNVMGIPEVKVSFKGERKVSTNREALEKIYNLDPTSRPFINSIFTIRDLSKIVSTLTFGMPDGRFRTSFNPVGTNTGRWSSSTSAFGSGSNIQNITYELREIFLADEGYYLGYTDLEQAEARGVAYYSGDANYIAACQSGDLHTYTARLLWPHLSWNGDLSHDRSLAESPFYRHFSYRDMSKRGGHATNYYATPWTVSRHLKIEQRVAEEFQEKYFDAFPGIRQWHHRVSRALMEKRCLTTALGRVRHFFGRPDDDATLRKAIAFLPQSTIVDALDTGLCRIAERYDPKPIELLAQMHDGIVWQSKAPPDEAVTIVERCLDIPIEFPAGTLVIPSSTKLGYNWKELVKPSEFGSLMPHTLPTSFTCGT